MPSTTLDLAVSDAPISVVDLETTGLHSRADRVVEIAVVHIPPDGTPELVLDTLVNPCRSMAATDIHGITDDDVADAPCFKDIATDVSRALTGTVIAAYNVYFDMPFLKRELGPSSVAHRAPHVCLMYMRPLLDLGGRCCLNDACRAYRIKHKDQHMAALDALAGAALWSAYRQEMDEQGIATFRDLAARKSYKFLRSLRRPLPRRRAQSIHIPLRHAKSRYHAPGRRAKPRRRLVREYWDAVKVAVADLEISRAEFRDVGDKQDALGLTPAEVRGVHGRVFAALLSETLEDAVIMEDEWDRLRLLHGCLSELGWAPGE